MKKKSTRRVFRDRKTGRFVSRATWNRSRAHGGDRYKRQAVKPPRAPVAVKLRRKAVIPARPAPAPRELFEWVIVWEYKSSGKKKKVRHVDFNVIAATKDDAIRLVREANIRGYDDARKPHDLSWTAKVPWTSIMEPAKIDPQPPRRERRKESVEAR